MEQYSPTFVLWTFSDSIYNLFKVHHKQIRFMQTFRVFSTLFQSDHFWVQGSPNSVTKICNRLKPNVYLLHISIIYISGTSFYSASNPSKNSHEQVGLKQFQGCSFKLPKTCWLEAKDLHISSLNMEIGPNKSFIWFIQLPFSCHALFLNPALTRSKRALTTAVCRLKIECFWNWFLQCIFLQILPLKCQNLQEAKF